MLSTHVRKTKKLNQVFISQEKAVLERIKEIDINSEDAKSLAPKIKGLWKQLIDLRKNARTNYYRQQFCCEF